MPRRRGSGTVPLPKGVHAIKAKRATYYYWSPNRGMAYAPKPIPLGKDPSDPEFWQRLRAAQEASGKLDAGTFRALIADYKASKKWERLRARTQAHYLHQLNRIEAAWGELPVAGLTVNGIYKLRAGFDATPVAANHVVSMLRTLLAWGLEHGYGERNPAIEITPIEIVDEENARPWPEEAYRVAVASAPEHIRRAVYLGRATGQRRSDLVKMGRKNRVGDGILFKIGKLRDREHFLPLTADQRSEIDSWSCSDTGPWIVSPTGKAMTGDHLRASLMRFLAKTPSLKGYDLELHGLRAMAACDRKMLGIDNAAIGKSIGMSTGMVERYTKHIDQQALARQVRDRLERAANGIVKSPSK